MRPTPWFWGINGAAAVVASTVSIGLSLTFGIYATLACGAACYLALGASAVAIHLVMAPVWRRTLAMSRPMLKRAR